MKNPLTVKSDMMSWIQNTFHNVDVYYLYAAPYINFLKYNEKSIIVGSVTIRRIHFSFQNVEV